MKIKHSLSILFMILLLASCKNGLTIFDQIDQETKLEDAVITGSVNSIVKSGDKLYASDGNIYAKDVNAVRGWSKIAGPGGTIIKLAADTNKVYALTGEYDLDTRTYKNKKLFYLDVQNGWESVVTSNISGEIETIFDDGFGTAYLQAKKDGTYHYYNISDPSSISPAADITSTVILRNDNFTVTVNNETVSVTVKQQTSNLDNGNDDDIDEDALYRSTYISSTRNSASNNNFISDMGTVYSLSYSSAENVIYAGTSKGLRKLPLTDDRQQLTGEVLDPPGNWGATISNSQAFAVLAAGDTTENAALYTSTIKGGSAYAKINGLWGYYYNRRSNWNRE